MTSLDDVAAIALALPNVTEGTAYGSRAWRVGKALFVWERPLRGTELAALGDTPPPTDPILGVRVDGLDEKEALLQAGHPGLFTTPHFDGSPVVLIELDGAEADLVDELVVDAWLCRASKRAAAAYLDGLRNGDADGDGN
ncbi:MAG: MmcQ/YjbR family DNA-binding protein [Actinomycetota bacterium]